jgi:ABC-2 type transport system permease protein
VKKYIALLKSNLSTSISYRADLVGTLIIELLSVSSAIILWFAIFRTNEQVGGYSLEQIVLYYILVPFVGFFTNVNVSRNLAQSIRQGDLSNQLLKPYKVWLGSLMEAVSKKIMYVFITFPLYGLLMYILSRKGLLSTHLFNLNNVLMGFSIVILGFLLNFVFDLFVSWLAFWFHDVWSFKHFKRILFSILGGISFPFDLLPVKVRALFDLLPFRFFYYTPISLLLGKSTFTLRDALVLAFWGLFFVFLSSIFWRKGIKRYEAYGN